MACSVSVPLLLPLLLASAVAYEYQQLVNVTNPEADSTYPSLASDCVNDCDGWSHCSGYVHENGQCTVYDGDCRGPGFAAAGEPAPTNYMARVSCPGEKVAAPFFL